LGPIPNPQSPIPKPQTPKYYLNNFKRNKLFYFNKFNNLNKLNIFK